MGDAIVVHCPVKKWDTAWCNLRAKAGLRKLRFHDLHHTIITELAKAGVPERHGVHRWASVAPNAAALFLGEITGQGGSSGPARRGAKFEEVASKSVLNEGLRHNLRHSAWLNATPIPLSS